MLHFPPPVLLIVINILFFVDVLFDYLKMVMVVYKQFYFHKGSVCLWYNVVTNNVTKKWEGPILFNKIGRNLVFLTQKKVTWVPSPCSSVYTYPISRDISIICVG